VNTCFTCFCDAIPLPFSVSSQLLHRINSCRQAMLYLDVKLQCHLAHKFAKRGRYGSWPHLVNRPIMMGQAVLASLRDGAKSHRSYNR
jgi:hypothetical protein